jgi:hypothetical protein
MARTKKRSASEHQRALPLDDATTRVLPIQLRVGDIVLDRDGAPTGR